MPIYEYRCSACGHQQEFLQKVSDTPFTTCTSCGKDTFAKMLTAAGFQLKGSGWYATDFKSKPAAPAAKADADKGTSGTQTKADGDKGASGTQTKADGDKGASGTQTKAEPKSEGGSGGGQACGSGGRAACS